MAKREKILKAQNINNYANRFCSLLNRIPNNEYLHVNEIGKAIGLNENRTKAVAFYIRRCAQGKDYESYIPFFIISGKGGYALLKKTDIEEQKKCFKSLYLRSQCIKNTIAPLEKALRENGVDIDLLIKGYSEEEDFEYMQEKMDEFVSNFADTEDLMNREGPDYWQ